MHRQLQNPAKDKNRSMAGFLLGIHRRTGQRIQEWSSLHGYGNSTTVAILNHYIEISHSNIIFKVMKN